MTKESEIADYRKRIHDAYNEIELCEENIDKLNGLTETCPHCDGEGRFMTVHRMFGHHDYSNCIICRGKGKITKEEYNNYKNGF